MKPAEYPELALGALLIAGIALVGCAAVGERPDGTATPAEAPVSSEGEARTESTDTDAVGPSPEPADCLHGSWLADNDYFLASMREFGGEPTSVTGAVTLTFSADGSVTTRYSDWRITVLAEGRESVITREGVDEGGFTADESHLSIHETKTGSILTVSAAGSDLILTPEPADYSNAEYECGASDARITTPDGTVILARTDG